MSITLAQLNNKQILQELPKLDNDKAIRLRSIVQVDTRNEEEKREAMREMYEPIVHYRMVVRAPKGCECHACYPQKGCLCGDCVVPMENRFLSNFMQNNSKHEHQLRREYNLKRNQHYSTNCMCYDCQKRHTFSPFIKND